MLSKDSFNDGIDKLLVEYGDRGFKMTKKRSELWYEHMKNMSSTEFQKKIDTCLMTCKRVPFMSDVIGFKDGDKFEAANAGAYEIV